MRISTKKILMAVLSLILIFAVSCGDKPTESTPEAGDALVSSVLSPKGNLVGESDALYHNGGKEYTNIILTFIESESDLVGNPPFSFTKEEFFGLSENDTNYTLSITNGSVTLIKETQKYTNTILKVQLLYKDGDKYNAGVSEEYNDEASKKYIEFKKGEDDNLTDFKYVFANLNKDDTYTYETKVVYKQNK